MDNKRRADREAGKTYSEISIIIQDGLMSHTVIPKLVDYSSTGAQFIADTGENIKIGLSAMIHSFVGSPPAPHVIEAKIVWVSDEAGQVVFGVEFLDVQAEPFELS